MDLVHIDGCSVYRTFRGVRLQDCSRGRVQNCRVYQTLESGVYLAAGDYSQNTGSSNFVIEGVRVDSAFHGGIQIIGGEQNTVSNCQVVDCANSAVILWHTLSPRVVNCVFHGNTHRPDAGLGGLGDSYGAIMCSAKNGFGATDEGYYLTALNNTMTNCGQGRADGKYAFWFGEFDTTPPAYQAIIDGNNTDATPVYKDAEAIPFVTTQYPSVVAGVSTAEFESLESDVQDNATAAAQNTVDIQTNATDIGEKQDTLTFSTVESDHEENPVTSKNIKAYVDANAGGSGATLGANTFTASQEFKSTSNIKLYLENTSFGGPLEIANNYGQSHINYIGNCSITFNGNKIDHGGGCTMLGMPVVTSKNTSNAAHNCLCVESDKLYFNSNGSWKELAFV